MISVLPAKSAYQVAKIEPYGFVILILLMMMGGLNLLLIPLVNGLEQVFWYFFS